MITFLEFLDYKENNNLSSDEYTELQSTLRKMMSDNLDLGNFVSNLKQFISNPKFVDFLKSGDENDALKITRKNIPVMDLIPTQDEIFLESSLDNGLTDRFGNLAQFLDGNAQVKGYVVTCMVNGSVFILDGHHNSSVCSHRFCCCIFGNKTACNSLKALSNSFFFSCIFKYFHSDFWGYPIHR